MKIIKKLIGKIDRKWLVVLCIILLSMSAFNMYQNSKHKKIEYNEFTQLLSENKIKSIEHYAANKDKIKGETADGKFFITNNPQSVDFKKELLESNVVIKDKTLASTLGRLAISILGIVINVLLFAVVYLTIMKSQINITNLDLEIAKIVDTDFESVAGNEEAKENIYELVDFIKNPNKYRLYGAKAPKGTILYGPPGTGKTLLARALAGTADVPFIAVSGSSFIEKYVGVGASRVRQVFEKARELSPCILFIDEIDTLGKTRGAGSGRNSEEDQTLNQLLSEMDGFEANSGVIVVAATNRLDVIDPALLRAGRFDRQIKVELPDLDARKEILKIYTQNKPISKEVDLSEIAKITLSMSGADIENLVNEASIFAARAKHEGILLNDFEKAINKIMVGDEKKNRSNISERDKKITAYHEAGHALIAKLQGESVSKVSIIPTVTGAGGYTLITPKELLHSTKREKLEKIQVLMGGRAAEEIVFGEDEITGGASHDIEVATNIASKMVRVYGMGKSTGLINTYAVGVNTSSPYEEKVVLEIEGIIMDSYEKSKEMLVRNKTKLDMICEILLENETILEKDLDKILTSDLSA